MRKYDQKKKNPESDLIPMLLTFILFLVLAFSIIVILFWPYIFALISSNFNIPLTQHQNVSVQNVTAQNLSEQLSPDAQFYFKLKNISCTTLSNDFLIVTQDTANSSIDGLIAKIPQENAVAQSIASSYDFNQTTKTYVHGDEMKKVIINGQNNLTLIWKDGRFYSCSTNCTMNLLSNDGWQAYLNSLNTMRTNCAFFGRTSLPDSVNISRLMIVQNTGKLMINGFSCQNFLIIGNHDYAQTLLSNATLSDDQRAIIWGLANQVGPITECLDDGDGVVVYRGMTLNLTALYNFNYAPGGGMFVSQQTNLTYYTNNVPESFLSLPTNQS